MGSKHVLIWRDPPPPHRGNKPGVWEERLAPLLERPQVWAQVMVCDTYKRANGTAGSLKSGKLRMPPGRFEFAARTLGDGTAGVFARWVGVEEIHLVPPTAKPRAQRPRKRSAA